MYTQCPECNTIFRVHEPQLEKAGGRVRCGQCMGVFNANEHQVDQLPAGGSESAQNGEPPAETMDGQPEGTEAEAASGADGSDAATEGQDDFNIETLLSTPDGEPPDEHMWPGGGADEESTGSDSYELAEEEDSLDVLDFDFGEAAEEETTSSPNDGLSMDAEPEPEMDLDAEPAEVGLDAEPEASARPSEHGQAAPAAAETPDGGEEAGPFELDTEPERRGGAAAVLLWSVLILLLTGALGVQYAYYNRPELARYETLRPWVEKLCEVAGCEVVQRRDISAIQLADRRVRSHPRFRDALLITATLVNDADFAQPYPTVEVRLEDVRGRPVAARRFRPEEYLDGSRGDRFLPGQEAQLVLEVADPGDEAVSFEFTFY